MDEKFDSTEFAVQATIGCFEKTLETLNKRVSLRKNKKIINSVKYMMDVLNLSISDFEIQMKNGIFEFSKKTEKYGTFIQNMIVDEINKQLNIYGIVDKVVKILEDNRNNGLDSIEKPDNDWINIYKEKAKLISDEEMQELWARILYGEFEKPGTYSLRTLEFLSMVNKSEAKLISKVISYSFYVPRHRFLIGHDKELVNNYGLTYEEILLLDELGIFNSSDNLNITFAGAGLEREDECYLINNATESITLNIKSFTKLGMELSQLGSYKYLYSDEQLKKIFKHKAIQEVKITSKINPNHSRVLKF